MFQSIRWRIALPYLILILLATAGLTIYLSKVVRDAHRANMEATLTAEAQLIGDTLASSSAWEAPDGDLDGAAQHYADLLEARITLIRADGLVLGESHADRKQMDNHRNRPEIQSARDDGHGTRIRVSRTMNSEMMYVAIPVETAGRLLGFARVALPVEQIEARVARLRRTVLLAALFAVLMAALLAPFIAERIAQPIRQLTKVVQRMAEGDLGTRLTPTTQDEVGTLTKAFNQMAQRLQTTINSLADEQRRLSAVLDNMADGVLITDGRGDVRLINPAAARILGVDEAYALNRSFAQVARDHRIIELWQACRKQHKEQVAPVEVDRQNAFLHVIVTPLQNGIAQACLVIIQDLTQIRRLETVRRDFISNISHELRTPMASLKALVDTLRNGALEDPPAARRFLDRMDVEVDALTQMVRELLELSRIESGQAPFHPEPTPAAEVVIPPIERLRPQAKRAQLQLSVDLQPNLPDVLADVKQVQQVITNLVHNAIKFTPPQGRITVQASFIDQEDVVRARRQPLASLSPCILIAVRDTGVGIPADDLPRIFERFYKADQARSGGGTGLGLAIAKHIVQGHNGHIWAESAEGEGSTFYVAIPAVT
jgi:two-component system phosphate regulon sensor histidine kinase PhoR